ncbi:hypothetical protein C8R47DRAFT_1066016 [Mycena vitilis]|nr:hypothetical protein C8R47DRAFT_1066016 [Mycena vitilis]
MSFPPPKLNNTQDDPGEQPPARLVSPLEPLACQVLRRDPASSFGPIDYQPPATNAFSRVRAAVSSEWVNHRLGRDPRIRPASIMSAQAQHTGRAVAQNGQEIFHAILLNARMLIHDPTTGQPGMRSGHVIAHMYAAPPGNTTWPMEVPVPGQQRLNTALPGYPPAVLEEFGKMRRDGEFVMHIDRQIAPVATSASSAASNNERALVLSPARSPPLPAVIDHRVNSPMPRLRAVSAQESSEPPTSLQLAIPRALGQIPSTTLRLPPISQLGLGTPTCAFQTAAPPRLSLGDGYRGPSRPVQSLRYLTHPPNAVPAMVTEPMRHLGLRANGHHVWSVPTGPTAAEQYPRGRAPDTPRLPLRMLDDAPELTRRAPESDTEMPDAGDTDAEGSTEDEEVSASYSRWAVSNCRLEKIQTAARRLSEDPSLSRDEAPKYVLNALQLEVVEPESSNVRLTLEDLADAAVAQKKVEDARNDVQAFEADVETGDVVAKGCCTRINKSLVFRADKCSGESQSGEDEEKRGGESIWSDKPGPAELTDPDGLDAAFGPEHVLLLPRLDSPLTSLSDSPPPLVSDSGRPSPFHIDEHDVSVGPGLPLPVNPYHPTRVATPFSDDCRSTNGATGFFDDGIHGEGAIGYRFPTFSDASSDEEEPVKLTEFCPYVPSTATPNEIYEKCSSIPHNWPIAKLEGAASFDFAKRLNREVRAMPAKAVRERAHNLTWIKMSHYAKRQEHQRLRMHAEDVDGLLAPIRRADALIQRSPNLVDITDMETDYMVDLDMLEQLHAPDHSPAGKARLEAQARELDEILDLIAPALLDGSRRVIDSPGVPVSVDGKRYREFSDSSKTLSVAHRVAIKAQVLRRRGPLVVYAVLRGCLLETIRLSEDFVRKHGWALHIVDLHQDAHECPPVLKDDEHGRLRLLMYAFARYEYPEVANAIDDVLAYRFYEPVVIRNLLEAGMLDPNDTIYVDGGPPGGIKIEARNVTGYPKVRERLFRNFRGVEAPPQPKRPFPGRYPRNWTQQVMVPSPIPEGFEDDDSSHEHSPGAEGPIARRAKL